MTLSPPHACAAPAPAVPARVLRPVPAPRLHEAVVDQLTNQIVSGAFPPGTALPVEPELAQRFGVSRATVREAVRVLTAKGLVAVRHGSGMWVEPPERWNYLDPRIVFAQVRAPGHAGDDALLDELIDARRLLETDVAGLAAARRTEADLASLRGIVASMATTLEDLDAYTQLDVRFHAAVLEAAHNRLLREALRPIAEAVRAGIFATTHRPSAPAGSYPHHRGILEAIERGDAAAARAVMEDHMHRFAGTLRRAVLLPSSQPSSMPRVQQETTSQPREEPAS